MMNDIFRDYLNKFVVIYLDDILIFSSNLQEHQHHVSLVLEQLQQFKLYCKLKKCQFHQTKLPFLGYIISLEGITMDPDKIKAVSN